MSFTVCKRQLAARDATALNQRCGPKLQALEPAHGMRRTRRPDWLVLHAEATLVLPINASGLPAHCVRATTPRNFPARAVGQIDFSERNGGNSICSGALIGASTVLTAGHCVHTGRGDGRGTPHACTFSRAPLPHRETPTQLARPCCRPRACWSAPRERRTRRRALAGSGSHTATHLPPSRTGPTLALRAQAVAL